jgi:ClpP class serine protease
MLKYRSSFGGCSTVEVRRAVRAAKQRPHGRRDHALHRLARRSCSGTSDLAATSRGGEGKPLYAFFANMGASAAYWVGSQADRSGGTRSRWSDRSARTACSRTTPSEEEIGIKLTVVSTGPFKGLGADGKVTEQLVSDVQREIDDLNERFLVAVAAGRGMDDGPKVRALADGRVHVGEKAVQEGLVDVVGTFDAAMQALSQEKPKMITRDQFDAYAAEHPEPWQPFVEAGEDRLGKAEAHQEEIARLKAVEAPRPGARKLAIKQFKAGARRRRRRARW